jgi:hypothetical protein
LVRYFPLVLNFIGKHVFAVLHILPFRIIVIYNKQHNGIYAFLEKNINFIKIINRETSVDMKRLI